jgi:N-formylglutamate amidohydrolase
VYRAPADAWGLDLWTLAPSDELVARSLEVYDSFYDALGGICDDVIEAHGRVVVLDLHSYNHRRGGPSAPADDPVDNPEIIVGTKSIEHPGWEPVIAALADTMGTLPFRGRTLDARRDVKFTGGHMVRWLNGRYGGRGCAIALEVKKFYMDEWTGELDEEITATVGDLLEASARAIRDALASLSD